MRTPGQAFIRYQKPRAYREEGLGFSIGGWHPFRANTYLPTLKKLDPLSRTSLGKAIWKPIEKVDRQVNKSFAKGKVWAQKHRKELQIAAAVALAAFGGMAAMGMFSGAGGAAAGVGAAGATEAGVGAAVTAAEAGASAVTAAEIGGAAAAAAETGAAVTTSTFMATETLAPLALSQTATVASFVPATVGAVAPVAAYVPLVAEGAAAASTGSGILATVGSIAKTAAPLLALSKALGAGAAAMPQEQSYGQNYGGGYGGGYSGGGGGFLGPMGPVDGNEGPQQEPTADSLPSWALPAAGITLLFLLVKD